MFRRSLSFYVAAVFGAAPMAHPSPVIEYIAIVDGSSSSNAQVPRPSVTLCYPDYVYEMLKQKLFFPPVEIQVRGKDLRVPWRKEVNSNVGGFGPTRATTSGVKFHAGTDLIGIEGDSVFAVSDGHVDAVRSQGKFGNYVRQTFFIAITPERRLCRVEVIYAHLDEILVTSGEARAGQVIGTMGRTGYQNEKTIPTHLHIELWVGPYSGDLDVRRALTRDILPLFASLRD